jgi:hypothetical protein
MNQATSEQGHNRVDAPSGKFQKGVSGNPGGRPRISAEVRDLVRSKAPRAFERLVDLMESQDERVAIAASNAVLDRAFGRPASEDRTATFEMRQITSAADIVAALSDLLKATANGDLGISEARELTTIIEAQRKAIETTDLEVRIIKLEGGSQ